MHLFSSLTIARKLVLMTAVILVLTAIFTTVSLLVFRNIQHDLLQFHESMIAEARISFDLGEALQQLDRSLLDAMASPPQESRSKPRPLARKLQWQCDRIDTLLGHLGTATTHGLALAEDRDKSGEQDELQALSGLRRELTTCRLLLDEWRSSYASGDATSAFDLYRQRLSPVLGGMLASARALNMDAINEMGDEASEVEEALKEKLLLGLSIGMIGLITCAWLSRHIILSVTTPIRRLVQSMALIRQGHLDVPIAPGASDEIGDLTRSFSKMVADLQEKTVSIDTLNREITRRKASEESQKETVRELNQSHARVKTLSGLLPICATCKKIRDDKGYWNQIETYLASHAGVDFSHSICPECMKRDYPEFMADDFPDNNASD